MSSETLSCSTVNPVTYAQPALAPSAATRTNAGNNDDIDATAMIATPVATTPVVNTACRGSRRCAHSSVTTPIAAPMPSAVISRPNAPLPPCSTSFATVGPSGTIAPPPISPPRQTDHHAAHERVRADEPQPFLDVEPRLPGRDPRARAPFTLVEPQARDQQRGEEERARVDPDRERALLHVRGCSSAWKPPSQCAGIASAANTIAPSGNVPNAATRPSELAEAKLLRVLDDVGNGRLLGRCPQQREDLDHEREDHQAPDVRPERQQQRAARRDRCRS